MTNREWVLSELSKMDDKQLGYAFCNAFDSCVYDKCPVYVRGIYPCALNENVEWMEQEHEERGK